MGWGGSSKGGWTPVWQPQFQKQEYSKGGGKGRSHKDFQPDQKMWIGGIPEGTTFKELHELMKQAGAKWTECFEGNGTGTGVACFGSGDEVQTAIAGLQGVSMNGVALQLDVWEKKPGAGRGKGGERGPPRAPPQWQMQPVQVQPVQVQPWGGKGSGKIKGKSHKDFQPETKVWIGGIPGGATFKELHELMKPAGSRWTECFEGNGTGTGVACFASEEDAQKAIAVLQGAALNGSALELDVWERKPKGRGKA